MAVSFQTIPMFHVAPSFPLYLRKYLPISLLGLVVILSWKQNLSQLVGGTILLSLCMYMACILFLLNKRKRKIPDTTIYYWQSSALSLFVVFALYVIPDHLLFENVAKKKTMLLTAIFIFFYVLSIIQGLLLKILPFLSYTHLQQRCLTNFGAMHLIPNMHEFLKKKHGQWLLVSHICAGIFLIVTILYPTLYWVFGSLLLIEFLGLLYLMLRTINQYKKSLRKINLLD